MKEFWTIVIILLQLTGCSTEMIPHSFSFFKKEEAKSNRISFLDRQHQPSFFEQCTENDALFSTTLMEDKNTKLEFAADQTVWIRRSF